MCLDRARQRRGQCLLGQLLKLYLILAVGREVGLRDLVLGIRVPGDIGNEFSRHILMNDDEFDRDDDPAQIGFVLLPCVEDGCGGLPSIDNLEVIKPDDPSLSVCFHMRGSGSETVVVGHESIRLIADGGTNSFVDFATH